MKFFGPAAIKWVVLFVLGLSPVLGYSQEFSADVVYDAAKPQTGKPTPTASSKIFVSKDKIRLENRGFTNTVLLVDGSQQAAYLLFPVKKTYEDLASLPPQYFRVNDVENACPDWQKTSVQTINCEKVGHQTVDGRDTVEYQNKEARGTGPVAVWIDVALKFVVKWQMGDAGAELRDIKEGQQSADLFVVPSLYTPAKPQKGSAKGFSPRR